jgi:hypothetical protein
MIQAPDIYYLIETECGNANNLKLCKPVRNKPIHQLVRKLQLCIEFDEVLLIGDRRDAALDLIEVHIQTFSFL